MNETSVSSNQILLLGQLLTHLRRQGFIIGVDHYFRLQSLLDRIGFDYEPDDLKTLLCPIFATSREQQEQFYIAFDSWLNLLPQYPGSKNYSKVERTSPIKEHEGQASRKWPYIFWALLTVMAIVGIGSLVEIKRLTGLTPINEQAKDSTQDKIDLGEQTGQASQVITEEPQFPLQPSPEPEQLKFSAWMAIALAVIFVLIILFILVRRYGYNRDDLVVQRRKRKKPPYTWPIKVVTLPSCIYDPEQFYKATRLLQHRTSDEYSVLDIQASVVATVESLGHTTLCYKPATKSPEYLVLIERASFNDHQGQFFNYLAKRMEQAGLFWVRYFYADDPRLCWEEAGETPVLLEELQHKYPRHRLLIFGDGKNLIDPITGKLEKWAGMFSEWEDRAIMTPEMPSSWGWKETVLADQFRVLPAILEGIMLLDNYFERPQRYNLSAWIQVNAEFPPELNSLNTVYSLRDYLGEETFQWLCACAIYPELHWDLTLHLGLLLDKNRKLVNEREILKLIRLPWFRQGFIPDDLRWLLLHELVPENERIVRYTLINLLERNIPPPTGTFAADVHMLNMAVQRWLYYRDRKTYGELLRLRRTLTQTVMAQDQTVLRLMKTNQATLFDIILPSYIRALFDQSAIFIFYRVTETALKLLQKLFKTIGLMYKSVGWGILKYLQKPLLYLHKKPTTDHSLATNIVTATTPDKIRILFLAANSVDVVTRLKMDKEIREIRHKIGMGSPEIRLDFVSEWAESASDLQEALLRYQPDIVHFSGHGGQTGKIMLEGKAGNSRAISGKALSGLFKISKDNVRIVFLNACYEKNQARALTATIDFTVGLNHKIEDGTAIAFASHFYQALGFGCTVKESFDLAVNQILIEGHDVWKTPELLVRHGANASKSRIVNWPRPTEPKSNLAKFGEPNFPLPEASKIIAGEHSKHPADTEKVTRQIHRIAFLPWLFTSIAISLSMDVLRWFLSGDSYWPDIINSIVQPYLIVVATIAADLTCISLLRPSNLLVEKAAGLGSFKELRKARRAAIFTGIALVMVLALWLPRQVFARYYNDRGIEFQYSDSPDLSRARESYQQAIRLDPSYAAAHYNLATVYEDLQPEEATTEYMLAIRFDDHMYPAYSNLARLYIIRGEDKYYENALNILIRASDLMPQDENLQYSLNKNFGWVNYAMKNYALAETYLRRAISLRNNQGGAAAHCLLAYVLKEQGKAGVTDECFDCVSLAPGEKDIEAKWVSDAQECLMKGGLGTAPTSRPLGQPESPGTTLSPKPSGTTNNSCGRIVQIVPQEPKGVLRIKMAKGIASIAATEGMLVRRGYLLILEPTARAVIICDNGRRYNLLPGPQGCPCEIPDSLIYNKSIVKPTR